MATYRTPGKAGGGADYDALNQLNRTLTTGNYGSGRNNAIVSAYYGGANTTGRATGVGPYVPSTEGISEFAGDINAMNRNFQQQANYARIPGSEGLEGQSSAMIADQLMGKVPGDVMSFLGQSAAERGVSSGMPGSPNVNAAYLRALGLTSMQQQESGQRNLSAAYARNPAAPLFNVEPFIMTPQQAAQIRMEEEKIRQQQEQLAIEWAKVNRMGGGGGGYGGGGGGGSAPAASTPFTPASLMYGSGASGMMYSSPQEPWYSGTGSFTSSGTPSSYPGYEPTSGGTSYIGSTQGYQGTNEDYMQQLQDWFGY